MAVEIDWIILRSEWVGIIITISRILDAKNLMCLCEPYICMSCMYIDTAVGNIRT